MSYVISVLLLPFNTIPEETDSLLCAIVYGKLLKYEKESEWINNSRKSIVK